MENQNDNNQIENNVENKTPAVEGFSNFSQEDKYVWGLFIAFALSSLTALPVIGIVFAIGLIGANFFLVKKDIEVLNKNGLTNPNLWWFLLPFVYLWQRCTIVNPKQRYYFYGYMLMWAMMIITSIVDSINMAIFALINAQ